VAWDTEHEAEITLYDVKAYDQRHTVDLQQRTCSCRVYQVSGNPCIHALTQWEQVDIGFPAYPPVQEEMPPGRPRVQRIRGFHEVPCRKVLKCKKCGRNGRFQKTSNLPPEVIAEPPPEEHTPTKRCHFTPLTFIVNLVNVAKSFHLLLSCRKRDATTTEEETVEDDGPIANYERYHADFNYCIFLNTQYLVLAHAQIVSAGR